METEEDMYIATQGREMCTISCLHPSSTWARIGLHQPYLALYRLRRLNRSSFATYAQTVLRRLRILAKRCNMAREGNHLVRAFWL